MVTGADTGVGVIADKGSHDMTVKDVDMIHQGVAGVNVWSGATKEDDGTVGRNFRVENVRIKDGHCDVSWYNHEKFNPSSGGLAFASHPAAKGVRFINSQYWNHCRAGAVYITKTPVQNEIIKQDFVLKDPPIEMFFPWLQSP